MTTMSVQKLVGEMTGGAMSLDPTLVTLAAPI